MSWWGPLTRPGAALWIAGMLLLSACHAAAQSRIPAIPRVDGALTIDVVWPPPNHALSVDSTFVFGSVGTGRATLAINGESVPVAANGAWLAFLPVPRDGRYEYVARVGDLEARTTREVVVLSPARLRGGRAEIVAGSLAPAEMVTGVKGEPLEVRVQATAGAQVTLVLPSGARRALYERAAIARSFAFMLERADTLEGISEYVGTLLLDDELPGVDPTGRRIRASAMQDLTDPAASSTRAAASVEVVVGSDTSTIQLATAVGVLEPHALRVGRVRTARADSVAPAQRNPGSDQEWEFFWPNGTLVSVDGEDARFYRVRLTAARHTWIAKADLPLLPPGTPEPRAEIGPAIDVTAIPDGTQVRFASTLPLPYEVRAEPSGITIDFFGASGRPAFVALGADSTLVERVEWAQPSDGQFTFRMVLREPLWGFEHGRDPSGALIVRLRRAPRIDPERPLRGLVIAVDAGHPPLGATGPTGLLEADATLAVARRLARELEAKGARVLQLREDTSAVALTDRALDARRRGAQLLVSVHFNAVPDGVDPFGAQGTMTFFYWPQSIGLARALQSEIVSELGTRDQGARFQNLAIPRVSWMPSVLTESLFLMFPENESALRNGNFQQRLAAAHVRGLEAFLRGWAAGQRR
jgi:N-acetylmuramoyl-L-alanine amidase